jgi:hypothetical protein
VILQLSPALWVDTPLGRGKAIIYKDDGDDCYWTVVLKDTGAIVQFRNEKIRASANYTLGRRLRDEIMRKIIREPLDTGNEVA